MQSEAVQASPAPQTPSSGPSLWRLPRLGIDAFRQWGWRHLAFYVGVPVLLALYPTINNWELLRGAGFLGSLAFYTAHSTIPWWINAAMCWLLFVLVPWFAGHRVLLICVGTTIASILLLPYADAVSTSFYSSWSLQNLHAPLHSEALADPIDGFLVYLARAAVLTVGVNWIFDQFLGLPRYRRGYVPTPVAAGVVTDGVPAAGASVGVPAQPASGPEQAAAIQPPPAPASALARPRFLDRLPDAVTVDAVLAIKAEQHYIRVFVDDKSHMTLYRFSDALAELANAPGLQINRSYWIRPEFVERIRSGSGKMTVLLRSGTEVPVSGPYKVLVRQMARQTRIPILPLTG